MASVLSSQPHLLSSHLIFSSLLCFKFIMASLLCSYFLSPPAVSLKKVVMKPSKILCRSQNLNGKGEDSSFFESFIEGMSSNLYIPAEAVKYKHWVDLAQITLLDLATSFDAQIDDEKMENKSCYFDVLAPSSQTAQIFVLEKDLVFMVGEQVLKEIPLFDVSKKNNKSEKSSPKWRSLVHKGVMFPPPYKQHNIPILYKGKSLNLTLEQEELATLYASLTNSTFINKVQFQHNFRNDWFTSLGEISVVKALEDFDFTPIYGWVLQEKEKKNKLSIKERAALKELEDRFKWVVVDGVKLKAVNFKIEPTKIFIGRGEHPKMGAIQTMVRPSDITINIEKFARVPRCPIPGESWKEVKHDQSAPWIASWTDSIRVRQIIATWEGANGEGTMI